MSQTGSARLDHVKLRGLRRWPATEQHHATCVDGARRDVV